MPAPAANPQSQPWRVQLAALATRAKYQLRLSRSAPCARNRAA